MDTKAPEYDLVKRAILHRLNITEETHRVRFREYRISPDTCHRVVVQQLCDHMVHWLSPTQKTGLQMGDAIAVIQVWIWHHNPATLEDAIKLDFEDTLISAHMNLFTTPIYHSNYIVTSSLSFLPVQIRETRQTMRDSESGLERMSIGHHIRERGHVMERSRNRKTGDREERQDFINLEESEAAAFDEEWRGAASRYPPPGARSLDYQRERSAGGGGRLALAAPPSRQDDDRQPSSRRYDW
ncbi:myeloid leukemia factor 2-like [Polyodon spathula]|uniref:myeloid leukemia factor 2-like n=1 Tax=Polyodon spathula TaxID=7913 RepID=UPI001B7F568B|nr:myeloid leukemia factor 2-like [Polyodon spathula]